MTNHSAPSSKCFAFVQTYDEKPKRRLFELLQSQGLQMNQQIEFLSDGGDTVRDLQLYLSPEAEHLLDWFHITMRLTTLTQTAKGLPGHDESRRGARSATMWCGNSNGSNGFCGMAMCFRPCRSCGPWKATSTPWPTRATTP